MIINISTLADLAVSVKKRILKDLYNYGDVVLSWDELIARGILVRSNENGFIDPVAYSTPAVELVYDADGNPYTPRKFGEQVWLIENYRYNYSGSVTYGDNPANEAIYGRMYSDTMVVASDFCPPGYHVPTLAELQELIDYLGGLTVAGGALKQTGTLLWQTPNTGATDIAGFGALPGGNNAGAGYNFAGQRGYYFTKTVFDPEDLDRVYYLRLDYDSAVATISYANAFYGSVRLIKD